MWTYVGKKDAQRWLWHAIDHSSGTVSAYVLETHEDKAFLELIAFQCLRIRAYFDQASKLIPMVEQDSRLALTLMKKVYVSLIDRIEKQPFHVLDRQIRLSFQDRIKIISQALHKEKTVSVKD